MIREKWSIWEDEVSRNSFRQIDGAKQRGPDCEDPKSRLTNIRGKSSDEVKAALSIVDRKRLTKSLPSKGGSEVKSQKSDKAQRQMEREKVQGNENLSRSKI